jgi:hypothetical protein
MKMLIKRKSPISGDVNEIEIDVTEEEIEAWKTGTLIQVAMPRASAGEREFILSGITEEEWKEMFKGDD